MRGSTDKAAWNRKQDLPFLRKEAKDFYVLALPNYPAMSGIYPWAPQVKVFCFFSSEKKTFRASLFRTYALYPQSRPEAALCGR
jgi:hypothetical protein